LPAADLGGEEPGGARGVLGRLREQLVAGLEHLPRAHLGAPVRVHHELGDHLPLDALRLEHRRVAGGQGAVHLRLLLHLELEVRLLSAIGADLTFGSPWRPPPATALAREVALVGELPRQVDLRDVDGDLDRRLQTWKPLGGGGAATASGGGGGGGSFLGGGGSSFFISTNSTFSSFGFSASIVAWAVA
jgi:uncharacterized membrane protein YgcG